MPDVDAADRPVDLKVVEVTLRERDGRFYRWSNGLQTVDDLAARTPIEAIANWILEFAVTTDFKGRQMERATRTGDQHFIQTATAGWLLAQERMMEAIRLALALASESLVPADDVTAEPRGKAVRINISIDRGLLKAIDALADAEDLSRSAILQQAASSYAAALQDGEDAEQHEDR